MSSTLLTRHAKDTTHSIQDNPPQAVLLVGPDGSGKYFLACDIARAILGVSIPDGVKLALIEPDEKNTIAIEHIRKIKEFVKLKLPKKQNGVGRIIIVRDGHRMRHEAQNALLKTLEEPPESTMFIVTARSERDLLPTVVSRLTTTRVKPVSLTEALDMFRGSSQAEITKAYHLSGGSIALLESILQQKEEHKLMRAMKKAKEIITLPVYERLKRVDDLIRQNTDLELILYCMKRITHYRLIAKPDSRSDRLRLRLLYEAERSLRRNTQKKLILTDLFLKM